MRARASSSRHRESGVAMTEAVIAMPVLLLLFLAMYYFHGAYRAGAEALREARAQAWAIKDKPECYYSAAIRDPLDTLFSALSEISGASGSPGANEYSGGIATSSSMLTTAWYRAHVKRTARVPRILGNTNGMKTLSGQHIVPCGEKEPDNILDAFFGMVGEVWNYL